MTRDPLTDDAIGWLVMWHRWEQTYNIAQGYPPECPSTRKGWLCSRQHDDVNGAAETDARGRRIRDVGHAVQAMGDPWTAALREIAKRHADGLAVYFHPRLPADKDERARIKAEALARFVEVWYG